MGNNPCRKGLANTSDLCHFASEKEGSNEIKQTKDTGVIHYQRHQMFTQESSTGDPTQHLQAQ